MNLDLSSLSTPEVVTVALLGVVVMFFGLKIKKVAFFLIWFVVGYYITTVLLPHLNNVAPEVIQEQLYQTLIPIAGGLLLAMLGFSIEKLCVGGIAFALVMLVTAQYFGTEIQTLAIGGVLGIVAAGVAIMSIKPATIILTSVAGAYTLTMALLVLVPNINQQIVYFPSLIGLSVLGGLVQFFMYKKSH